jgi:hypothetical protein
MNGSPEWSQVFGVTLSLLAIIVSVLSWVTSWKTQKRLVVIEESRERDRLRQTRKAKIRAELAREQRGDRIPERLRIYNDGESEAREVTIKLAGKPIREHRAVIDTRSEISQVGPRSCVQYMLALTHANFPPWGIEITWIDDSGEPGIYRTTITA